MNISVSRWRHCSILALTIISATDSSLFAAEPAQKVKVESPKDQSPAIEKLDHGPIEPTSAILGSKVLSEKGETVGQVNDLMLDLQRGHASVVIVELHSPEKGKSRTIAIPWNGLQRKSDHEFQIRVTYDNVTSAPGLEANNWITKTTHRWAASIHSHFGVREREFKPDLPKPNENDLLVRVTALNGARVNDSKGQQLGHLAGFAIAARDGVVVYAALATSNSDEKLQAIPLSAFIVKPTQKEWMIEITKDALTARPTFPAAEWPQEIDRGWSEYVHVLYGRPIFEGVRSASKGDEKSL